MTCPLIGTNFRSSHKNFAPIPEQLTISLYSGKRAEKFSILYCFIIPPFATNFWLTQGKNKLHSVSKVVKYAPYFQLPGQSLSSFCVAGR